MVKHFSLSKLNRLARKWLPVAILATKFVILVVELVSKAVNYARSFRKFHSFVYN